MKKQLSYLVGSLCAALLIGCCESPSPLSVSDSGHSTALVFTGGANDIGVGKTGNVWIVSKEPAPSGGCYIYKYNLTGTTWTKFTSAGAVAIDVSPNGNPWIVDNSDQLFMYSNGKWVLQPKKAKDVGIGSDGSVWIVSNEPAPHGGYNIYKLIPGAWVLMTGAGTRIDVDSRGRPWLVNSDLDLYAYDQYGNWNPVSVKARDVGIGGSYVFIVTSGYGCAYTLGGSAPYNWTQASGTAYKVSVSHSGTFWKLDGNKVWERVYQQLIYQWKQR